MNRNDNTVSVGTRLAAMLLEHVFMTFIAMVFFLPSMIAGFADAFNVSHEPSGFNFMEGPLKYIGLFGFALYFCKDIVNGRSIAKRILKLQVVDNKTGQVASPLQCFVRNIFCILWPIEVIVAMVNTGRRLGDRVAGTKLVHYDPAREQPKPNPAKLALPLVLSYGLLMLFMSLVPETTMAETNYSKTSYNAAESKALEQLVRDNLGQYLTPDIRVYDTVKNENVKYLSAIFRLKENYLADYDSYNRLHTMTTDLIYSKMPEKTFTGKIQYVYRAGGQVQTSSTTIGTYIRPKEDRYSEQQ